MSDKEKTSSKRKAKYKKVKRKNAITWLNLQLAACDKELQRHQHSEDMLLNKFGNYLVRNNIKLRDSNNVARAVYEYLTGE